MDPIDWSKLVDEAIKEALETVLIMSSSTKQGTKRKTFETLKHAVLQVLTELEDPLPSFSAVYSEILKRVKAFNGPSMKDKVVLLSKLKRRLRKVVPED